MNPIKSIKSRYSLTTVNSNYYGSININSTNFGTNNNGSVFAPYILAESIPLISEMEMALMKQELRLKKLERLLGEDEL